MNSVNNFNATTNTKKIIDKTNAFDAFGFLS